MLSWLDGCRVIEGKDGTPFSSLRVLFNSVVELQGVTKILFFTNP